MAHSRTRPTVRPLHDRERSIQKLLQIAVQLFASRGYHGVSVDEIAESAGLSKRMPYYYFGSKEKIYRQALIVVYKQIENMEANAIEAEATPVAKLEALMRGYFVFLRQHPEFVQLVLWENLAKGKHFPHGLLTKMRILKQFIAIVEEGIAKGQFRKDLDIPHLFINVIGLSFIYFSNRYSLTLALKRDLGTEEELERAVRQVLCVLFDGIILPRGRPRGAS